MALKLSSVTDHGIGSVVLVCLVFNENQWKPSNPKLRQFRRLDGGALTSFFFFFFCFFFFFFFLFLVKKPNLTCHIINTVHKEGTEKDGPNGLNKSQLFALCSVIENYAFTPFLYFLIFPEASLEDGVFKCIVYCA